MDQSELLTPREAAALLRINLDTVRRLLREGQLPGRKVGPRQWRIRRADLEAYLSPLSPALVGGGSDGSAISTASDGTGRQPR